MQSVLVEQAFHQLAGRGRHPLHLQDGGGALSTFETYVLYVHCTVSLWYVLSDLHSVLEFFLTASVFQTLTIITKKYENHETKMQLESSKTRGVGLYSKRYTTNRKHVAQ